MKITYKTLKAGEVTRVRYSNGETVTLVGRLDAAEAVRQAGEIMHAVRLARLAARRV